MKKYLMIYIKEEFRMIRLIQTIFQHQCINSLEIAFHCKFIIHSLYDIKTNNLDPTR